MNKDKIKQQSGMLYEISKDLADFAMERDWDQFHTPKNLSMALSVEVSELVEIYQWLTTEESQNLSSKKKMAVQEELGDIMIYLVRIADKAGVDLLYAANEKIKINRQKYPVEQVKGKAHKYTEYQND